MVHYWELVPEFPKKKPKNTAVVLGPKLRGLQKTDGDTGVNDLSQPFPRDQAAPPTPMSKRLPSKNQNPQSPLLRHQAPKNIRERQNLIAPEKGFRTAPKPSPVGPKGATPKSSHQRDPPTEVPQTSRPPSTRPPQGSPPYPPGPPTPSPVQKSRKMSQDEEVLGPPMDGTAFDPLSRATTV
ncbi:basic proline-rich protein-like [Penaeus monodon]|uniref:basic proline-rich protein-like n=1 Tax=Penaeus monodon TaxID=6687 RepID=UPI0018A7458B|nr:basic proline-rich protein-like [Penaeus monodon]